MFAHVRKIVEVHRIFARGQDHPVILLRENGTNHSLKDFPGLCKSGPLNKSLDVIPTWYGSH